MHKLLIYIGAAATLALAGCGGNTDWSLGSQMVRGLDRLPLVYRPTIQQGNIVSQEALNELRPGMTTNQVRFVLGTPMLIDTFHADRWDYVYTAGVGSRPDEKRRVQLRFENDLLVAIEGDMRPEPVAEREPRSQEIVVEVPDWTGGDGTLLGRALRAVGLGRE